MADSDLADMGNDAMAEHLPALIDTGFLLIDAGQFVLAANEMSIRDKVEQCLNTTLVDLEQIVYLPAIKLLCPP